MVSLIWKILSLCPGLNQYNALKLLSVWRNALLCSPLTFDGVVKNSPSASLLPIQGSPGYTYNAILFGFACYLWKDTQQQTPRLDTDVIDTHGNAEAFVARVGGDGPQLLDG